MQDNSRRPRVAKRDDNTSAVRETYNNTGGATTLLDLLQLKSGRSKSAAKRLIASGRVSVQGRTTVLPLTALTGGECVTVHQIAPPKPFTHDLIFKVWENDDFLIVRKEAGIATVNTSHNNREHTALWLLSQHYKITNPEAKLFMVSRLDKETAGFVVFAKSIEAKEQLTKEWHKIVQEQRFVAVVSGAVAAPEGELIARSSLSGDSKTLNPLRKQRMQRVMTAQYKVLKSGEYGGMHVIEVKVGGTRIFSIRKLLGDNGLVIAGDGRYRSEFKLKNKIVLEQFALVIKLPDTGRVMTFERPFPTHFFGYLKEDQPLPLSRNQQTK